MLLVPRECFSVLAPDIGAPLHDDWATADRKDPICILILPARCRRRDAVTLGTSRCYGFEEFSVSGDARGAHKLHDFSDLWDDRCSPCIERDPSVRTLVCEVYNLNKVHHQLRPHRSLHQSVSELLTLNCRELFLQVVSLLEILF